MATLSAGTIGTRRAGRRAPGFTLIEVMVVLAIVMALAVAAYSAYSEGKPRSDLSSYGVEIEQAIRGARQQALARGRDVAVLFYQRLVTKEGMGRVVVMMDDARGGFMGGGAIPSFCTYDPTNATAAAATDSSWEILQVVDLPRGLTLSSPPVVVGVTYPFNAVPWPAGGCSFCDAGTHAGAIRFDAKGRASFYGTCGLAGSWPNGGSVSVTHADLRGAVILMVTPFGIVRSFHVG